MATQTHYYIILILLLNCFDILAQDTITTWNRKLYQDVIQSEFRHFHLFQQKIDQNNPDYPLLNACLFYLTNEFRLENNKTTLKYSPQLETAAWHHSKKMLEDDFFGHLNPQDEKRETNELRAKLAGIRNPVIAENIAMRSRVPKSSTYIEVASSIFEQWVNSEGQKANLLSNKAVQLGCGVFTDAKRWYATQCFQNNYNIISIRGKDHLPPHQVSPKAKLYTQEND